MMTKFSRVAALLAAGLLALAACSSDSSEVSTSTPAGDDSAAATPSAAEDPTEVPSEDPTEVPKPDVEAMPIHDPQLETVEPGAQMLESFGVPVSLETQEPLAIAVGEDHIDIVATDGSRSILIMRPTGMANPDGPLYADALYEPLTELDSGNLEGLPVEAVANWMERMPATSPSAGGENVIAGVPSTFVDFTAGATPVQQATGGDTLAIVQLGESVVTVEPGAFYRMRVIPHPDGDLLVLVTDPELQTRTGETTTWSDAVLRPMDLE